MTRLSSKSRHAYVDIEKERPLARERREKWRRREGVGVKTEEEG